MSHQSSHATKRSHPPEKRGPYLMQVFDRLMHRLEVLDRIVDIGRLLHKEAIDDLRRRDSRRNHWTPGGVLVSVVKVLDEIDDLS